MKFSIGDLVKLKNSTTNDIFEISNITDDRVTLIGKFIRSIIETTTNDIIHYNDKVIDDFIIESIVSDNYDRNEYFYMPAKILHIDADNNYLNKCINYYKGLSIKAKGIIIDEKDMPIKIRKLLIETNPDILVITGHDSFNGKDKNILSNYKNSSYFCETVSIARKYEKDHNKLVIVAGACQSNYELLIKSGANFASSPKRINIHALDPAIVASEIALTSSTKNIDIIDVLNKTKYGSDGMGGIITNGLMYVGYPK